MSVCTYIGVFNWAGLCLKFHGNDTQARAGVIQGHNLAHFFLSGVLILLYDSREETAHVLRTGCVLLYLFFWLVCCHARSVKTVELCHMV